MTTFKRYVNCVKKTSSIIQQEKGSEQIEKYEEEIEEYKEPYITPALNDMNNPPPKPEPRSKCCRKIDWSLIAEESIRFN